jgi:hypothetical protein
MFGWYIPSNICLIFLSDVPNGDDWKKANSSFVRSR